MIKGHGDDIHNYTALRANFSSNVSAVGTHPSLVEHLQSEMSVLCNYPEPNAETLTAMIGALHGLDETRTIVCNGATEAFYMLANYYRGAKSLIFTPSFSEYEDACRCAAHDITFVKNRDIASADFSQVDMAWLCNPNNPDAFCFDKQWVIDKVKGHANCLFIIDEAYIEFTTGVVSMISELATYDNLVVIRSMTKRYAIPALRLGYMLGSESLMQELRACLMPWRLNAIALKAGEFVLSPTYTDAFDLSAVLHESQKFQAEVAAIAGVEVLPSHTSFFLVKSTMNASELKQRLVEDYGLLIRDASNFRGLTSYHFRLAVQSTLHNQMMVDALHDIFD